MMGNLRVEMMMMMMVVVVMFLALYPMEVMGGPTLHKVGGSKGWHQDVNYTEWAADQEHFYVGDWLLFVFDDRYYNVLEVNKTSYENCIDKDFIKNVTRGGRDVVQLTEPRTYYYISSGGYCFHQMRVAVNVEEHKANAPAPEPAALIKSGSILPSAYTCSWIILANVLFMNLVLMGTL